MSTDTQGWLSISTEGFASMNAAHAEGITRAQRPSGRLSAVPSELLDSQDRHKLLAAWLRGEE
jgi:hypothetical protein